MKLYIPSLGDKIKLISDWSFSLHHDYRNSSVMIAYEKLHPYEVESYKQERDFVMKCYNDAETTYDEYYRRINNIAYKMMLPKDTILSIDRIYIRKGQSDYDSVTFNILQTSTKEYLSYSKGGLMEKFAKSRFWAKLKDVNNIEFEPVDG